MRPERASTRRVGRDASSRLAATGDPCDAPFDPGTVLAIDEAREIPPRELVREDPRRLCSTAQRSGGIDRSTDRQTDHVARHPQQIAHRRRAAPVEHSPRYSTPEAPPPEVALRQAFRRDVVMDDEI